MDELLLKVEVDKGVNHLDTDLRQMVKSKIKNNVGITVDVQLQPKDSIPKSEGGKLNRVLDNR